MANETGQASTTFLVHHGAEIREQWLAELRKEWGGTRGRRWQDFAETLREKSDCLSVVAAHTEGRHDDSLQLEATIQRIQSENFQISDLMFEIATLKRSLRAQEGTVSPGALFEIFGWLDDFVDRVIRDTSNIYENVSELGDRGLLLLDKDAQITYSNRKAHALLGAQTLKGQIITSYLEEDAKSEVRDAITGVRHPPARAGERLIRTSAGETRTMSLEIASLPIPTVRAAGYVIISEPGFDCSASLDALEDFDQGVIRVDLETRRVLYLNQEGRRLLGVKDYANLDLFDLITDPRTKQESEEAIARRKQGRPDFLKNMLWRRQDTGEQVPFRLIVVPERGADAKVRTSFAFIESCEVSQIDERLDNVIAEAAGDWRHILGQTAAELGRFVSRQSAAPEEDKIELITFSTFNPTETFARVRYIWDNQKQKRADSWPVRWYEIPPKRLKWLKRDKIQNEILEEFLRRPENADLRDDQAMLSMQRDNIVRFLYRPIFRDQRIVACVSFLTNDRDAYNEEAVRRLQDFPIDKPIKAVFANESRNEEAQLNKLIQTLTGCTSMKRLAQKLVQGIAHQFQWSNVAAFRINDYNQTADLLYQAKAHEGGYALPRWFKQSLKTGLIGLAARQGRMIRSDDVQSDPKYRKHYREGNKRTHSELALPVRLSDRVFWVINIEDQAIRAFSDDEIRQLQFLVRHIERLLDGLAARYIYDTAMKETSDAVFVTDDLGRIRYINPSAAAQLGYGIGKKSRRNWPRTVEQLFVDPADAKTYLSGHHTMAKRVTLRCAGYGPQGEAEKQTREMLISMFHLPEELHDRYLVGKDLERHKRIERDEDLRHIFGQIGREIRVPLSNLRGCLHRLQHQKTNDSNIAAFVARAQRQLHRLEAPHQRIALYDADDLVGTGPQILIDLHLLIGKIGDELGDKDDGLIDLRFPAGTAEVVGDPYQIRFVYETILSFLVSRMPLDSRVTVEATSDQGIVTTEFSAPVPVGLLTDPNRERSERDQLLRELILGTRTIDRFLGNHGGDFGISQLGDGGAAFVVHLPAAEI